MCRRPGLVGLNLRATARPAPLRRSRSTGPRGAGRSPSSSRACGLGPAAPLRLRPHLDDVDGLHLHVEELLDGLPDLRLVRVRMHAERVLPVLDQAVALLGDHRREQDFVRMEAHAAPRFSASLERGLGDEQRGGPRRGRDLELAGVMTSTRSRFRKDLIRVSSSSVDDQDRGLLPQASSRPLPASSTAPRRRTVDEREVPPSRARERGAEGRLAGLLVDLDLKLVRGWKATPPPVQCGARVVPARARPVPFWRHGFPRPPAARSRGS